MAKNIRIIDISKAHVLKIFKSASRADREWIMERIEYWMKEKGVRYFSSFRSEFARKFHPSLFAKKTAKKHPTFLDELKQIDEQIKAATQETATLTTNKKNNKAAA